MGPFTSSRIAVEETLEKAACFQKTASSTSKISKRFSMKFREEEGCTYIIQQQSEQKRKRFQDCRLIVLIKPVTVSQVMLNHVLNQYS